MRIALAIVLLSSAAVARADPKDPLRYDLAVDGTIAGAGAVLWLGSEFLFKHQLAPQTCRWCADDGFDRAVRDELKWSSPATAEALSNVSEFGVMPLVTLGGLALAANHDGAARNIGADFLVVGEAAMLAQDVNQLVKFSVGRERPFVHALADDQKALTAHPDDNNVSFFSGHTTFAFSLATAAGTVASMHGYRAAPWIWAGGLTFATATGLLRIGADKHYATDVLAGALVGSAFGIGLPRLLHPVRANPATSQLQLSASPLGLAGQF